MKVSARNILRGKIAEGTTGQTTAYVRIDIGGTVVTASITDPAVDDPALLAGKKAYAVLKPSNVLIGVDE